MVSLPLPVAGAVSAGGPDLGARLAESLGRLLGARPRSIGLQPVRGGYTHAAFSVEVEVAGDRCRYFAKANAAPFAADAFESEALALRCIAETGALRVPEALHVGALDGCGGGAFTLFERLELAPPTEDTRRRLGAALARLHAAPPPVAAGAPPDLAPRAFGFAVDTFLGSTRQPNGWSGCWPSFFADRRLRPQLAAVAARGLLREPLRSTSDQFVSKAHRVLSEDGGPPRAALVHGDLWPGNFGALAGTGEPALFDPAACLADPEVDLAYMSLFASSFGQACFQAYAAAGGTLRPGWPRRRAVYRSYFQLGFCALLGEPYLRSAEAAVEGVLRM